MQGDMKTAKRVWQHLLSLEPNRPGSYNNMRIVSIQEFEGGPYPREFVGGCILLVQLAVIFVRSTSPWYRYTNWLASLVR